MNNSNICVIDDNLAVGDSLKFLFESSLNLRVKTYHEPLLFLHEFHSNWKGCLVVNFIMPAINGIDLIREIKKINENSKVIIISGHGASDTATKALAAGASAFINKPYKTDLILEKIKTILNLAH